MDNDPKKQAAGRRKVQVDDLYRYRLISEPQLSPDGRNLAYVLTRLRKKKNDYASNIWLLDPAGGEPRKFTNSDHRDMMPRWSPDGEELAFLSTRTGKPQIWVISMRGGEARQLTRTPRAVSEFEWSPDGRWIAFTTTVDNAEDKEKAAKNGQAASAEPDSENRTPGTRDEEGMFVTIPGAGEWPEDVEDDADDDKEGKKDRVRVIDRLHFKAEGQGFLERRSHIFIVPTGGGDARQLTEGEWDAGSPRWSPDGTRLAFLANQEPDADYINIQDILVMPVSDDGTAGEQVRVTAHNCAIGGISWLPDGSGFAVFAHSRVNEAALGTNLQVWSISLEGAVNKLTEDLDLSAGSWLNTDLRAGVGQIRPHFSPAGDTIFFLVTNGGAVQVYSVPIAGGEARQVIGGNRMVLNFTVSDNTLVFAASTPTNPNDIYRTDLDGSNERRLTNINADIIDVLLLSDPSEFWITRPGGVRVQGWIMLPPDYQEGTQYPLVLQIHGGPHTAYGWSFFQEFQVLAARGSIVLFTNPRGSQGYGQQFNDAIINDWGGVDYDDLMACVDYAVELGNVDEDRLGVAGGSYGGYMTTWIIGHTQRFKAAVAMRAVTNLYSAWGNGDFTWMLWTFELQGSPQERTDLYLERSPVTYTREMHTPLLLTHAEDDLRVNIEQSEQLYVALKVLRRDVKLVRLPSGGHDVSRSGKPSIRVERLEHIAGWFDKYLHSEGSNEESGS